MIEKIVSYKITATSEEIMDEAMKEFTPIVDGKYCEFVPFRGLGRSGTYRIERMK